MLKLPIIIQITKALRLKSRKGVYFPQIRTFLAETRKHLAKK